MDWFWNLLIMIAMVIVAIAIITAFQRYIAKPGSRDHVSGLGAAATSLDFIYNPHAAKARQDLEEQSRQRVPIPSPGDLPKGVVFELDDDGVPTKVVIRPSQPGPEGDPHPR